MQTSLSDDNLCSKMLWTLSGIIYMEEIFLEDEGKYTLVCRDKAFTLN
jgi:hypothetical protein